MAASGLALEVNGVARWFGSTGTVGYVRTIPGVFNVIAERAEMSIDLRNKSSEELEKMTTIAINCAKQVASKHGVEVVILGRADEAPAVMSKKVADAVRHSAEDMGVRHTQMVGGAVHDTMNVSSITDTGMIFVPSMNGLSHAPAEATGADDLVLGADVLLSTVLRLARGPGWWDCPRAFRGFRFAVSTRRRILWWILRGEPLVKQRTQRNNGPKRSRRWQGREREGTQVGGDLGFEQGRL